MKTLLCMGVAGCVGGDCEERSGSRGPLSWTPGWLNAQ